MQQLAGQMNVEISPEVLLAGLHPSLAGTTMAFGSHTTSLDDLFDALRAAELMTPVQLTDSASVAALTAEIKRLSTKIDQNTVRHATSPSLSTPRRVSFSNSLPPSPSRRQDQLQHRQRQQQSPHRGPQRQQQSHYPQQQQHYQQSRYRRCNRCNRSHLPGLANCPSNGKRCVNCCRLNHFRCYCRSPPSIQYYQSQQSYFPQVAQMQQGTQ